MLSGNTALNIKKKKYINRWLPNPSGAKSLRDFLDENLKDKKCALLSAA
jgi:hypothetical protein